MSNGGRIDVTWGYKTDTASYNAIKTQLQDLTRMASQMSNNNIMGQNSSKDIQTVNAELEKSRKIIQEVETAYDEAFDSTTGITNINKLSQSLKGLGVKDVENAFTSLGTKGVQAWNNITSQITKANFKFRETNNFLSKMGETLSNTVKWGIASSALNKFTGSVQEAWGYVKHLDTSLNDIRIVTGKSADEMDKFAVSANNAAQRLGAATTEYTEAALIYYQQGLADDEAAARAETTIKAANVTGQTGKQVSEELTAVWNGYKVTAEETELYVDKLAAVAASTASDLEELSTGMSKVASAANNMGVDVDQLNAQLSTIISVTRQAPETAGTALKTIYARMEDLKISGEDEYGVKLGDVSSTLDEVGVHIMDVNGDIRDLGEVIEEVGDKWYTWTEAQRSAIAQAIAGKRQYNNLLALFDNWDKYNKALETSQNATGTLQKQQDIYMESTAAHIQQLETEWEGLYDSLIDNKDVNKIIDSITFIVDKFSSFIDIVGGGRSVLAGLIGLLGQIPGITTSISNQLGSIMTKMINAKINAQEWANVQTRVKEVLPDSTHAHIFEEISQYENIMTNENRQQILQYADEIKALEDQKVIKQDLLQLSLDQIKAWEQGLELEGQIGTEEHTDIQKLSALEPISKDSQDNLNYVIEEEENAYKEAKEALQEYLDELDKFERKRNEYDKAINEEKWDVVDKRLDDLERIDDELTSKEKNLRDLLTKISSGNEEAVDAIIKDLNSTRESVKDIDIPIEKLDSDIKDLGTTGQKEFGKINSNIQETKKSIKSTIPEIANTSDALGQAKANLQDYINNLAMDSFADGTTKAVTGLSSLAFGIQSIQNLGSIWKNEDASTGEKILSTITALSAALPMLTSGFSNLTKGLSILKTGFTDISVLVAQYSSATEATAIATSLLKGLTNETIVSLYGEAVATEVAEGKITGKTVATILDTEAQAGNLGISKILTTFIGTKLTTAYEGATTAITATATALKSFIAANPVVLLAALATAVAKVAIEIKKARAEAQAATSESNLEISQKDYEDAKNYADAIHEVADAYEELSNKYQNQEITLPNLRSQVYDLIQAHDLQVDAIEVLTASYDELNEIMKDVSSQATQAQNDAQKNLIQAQKQNVIAQSEKYTTENASVFKDYGLGFLSNFDMAKTIQRESGVSAMDAFGNIDWDIFYKSSKEQQNKIISILEDYEAFNDRAKDALNTIRDNQSVWDDIQDSEKEYNKNIADAIYSKISEEQNIDSTSDFNEVKEKLANQIATELEISYEQGLKLAEETLSQQNDLIEINASFSLSEQLTDSYHTTVDDLANEISNLSISDITFLEGNIDLAKAYDSLDEFLDAYKDVRDALQEKDNILKIQTILTNADGSAFNPDDITDLFSDKNFEQDFNQTQEEFENKTYDQQMSDLLTYYLTANKLETEYNASKKQALLDEQQEKQDLLIKEKQSLDELKQKIIDTYNVDETSLEEGYNKVLTNSFETAAQNMNIMYGYDIIESDSGLDILEKYIEGKEELNEVEQEYLEYLAKANGTTVDQLNTVYNSIKAYEDFTDQLHEANIEGSSYSEIAGDIEKQLAEVEAVVSDIDLSDVNWGAFGDGVDQLIDSTQNGIDNLQSAYSSLTSVMEDYNETGALTMDNLQTLLTMDTEYLSALQIENGQMSINEESLKQIALARLDEAEAEAYEQAMSELNDEARRREIESAGTAVTKLENLGTAATNAADAARNGVDAWNSYWSAALHENNVDNSEYAQQVGDALYTKLAAIEAVRNQITSGDFSTTMGVSSSTSDTSSSSSNEPDTEEYLEREEDLYQEINDQLDEISDKLDRIDTIQSHTWGINYANNLKTQNDLLKNQIELLEEKKNTYESDLSNQRSELESQGFTFNESGSSITNQQDVLDELYAEYNSMVDTYNSMTADEQDSYESTLEAKKDAIDEIENAIDDYNDAYDNYNDTLDELLDAHYELIENEVNSFNASIDVQLELDDAKEEWNDFWYEVIEDVEDTDFGGKIAQSLGKLDTLIGTVGDQSSSEVSTLTEHLSLLTDEVNKQIASADRGGEDSMFKDDTALSKETIETYRDDLMDAVRSAKEEIDDMMDTYLDALDEMNDKIDDHIDGWKTVGDHIEHNVELIQLVSGEEAFDAIGKQYEQLYQNNLTVLEADRMAKEEWQAQVDRYSAIVNSMSKDDDRYSMYVDALDKARENLRDAISRLDDDLIDALKDKQEQFKNTAAEIAKELDKAMSGGIGMDRMKNEWDLAIEEQEHYLDNVERSFNMEELDGIFNDILESMEGRNDLQQEFLKFQDEEIAKLNAREKLTQYDIDELKARLEIKRQELALEEAQQNKSNLRLRRDSQGNYNYQYVANDDDVEDAESSILTAKKDWYELVKKRNVETAEAVMEIRSRMAQAEQDMADAVLAHDEDAWNKAHDTYITLQDRMKEYMGDAEKAKRDFFKGTAEFFSDVENNTIVPMWDTTVEHLIDKWSSGGEDSFIGSTTNAINQLEAAQETFASETNTLLTQAGVNYNDLVNDGIDPTTEALEDLNETNEELNEYIEEQNDLFVELEESISNAVDAYNELEDAAVSALEAANTALTTLAETAITAVEEISNAASSANTAVNSTASNATNGSSGSSGGTGTSSSSKSYTLVDDPNGARNTKGIKDNSTGKYVAIFGTDSSGKAVLGADQKELYRKLYGVSLKTGGYTGTWNQGSQESNGRLAFLHQKELVLNEADTTNILNAVNAVRDLVSSQGVGDFSSITESIISSARMTANILAQVGTSALSALASTVNNNSETQNYRNMTVNADFSGVRSADAIYQALMELDNYGSQQAYSSSPESTRRY